jgi:hypothetical protein
VVGGIKIMQILKTREELEALFVDTTTSVGYVSLGQKITASSLHPGHEDLVAYAKTNFDVTVVSFWDIFELVYQVYRLPYLFYETGLPWDSTGCIEWCEVQGADYVLIPDNDYSAQYIQSVGIDGTNTEFYDLVNGIWQENSYISYEPTPTDASLYTATMSAKTFVMMQNVKNHFNNTFIGSWKDGFPRFTITDYVNRYTPEAYIMIDPIKTPDGIYYSSGYFRLTEAQKDIIKQFEGIVDAIGYQDTTALIVALQDLDPNGDEGLLVRRIDTIIGGVVGEANDFVNIQYSMSNYPDAYPIYKKGVR